MSKIFRVSFVASFLFYAYASDFSSLNAANLNDLVDNNADSNITEYSVFTQNSYENDSFKIASVDCRNDAYMCNVSRRYTPTSNEPQPRKKKPVKKGNFFVGANFDIPITSAGISAINLTSYYGISSGAGWGLGIVGGYRQFFAQNFGLKYYLNYMFGQTFSNSASMLSGVNVDVKTTLNQHWLSGNVDFFYNFYEISSDYVLGAYVGLGIGFLGYQPSFNVSGNVSNINGSYSDSLQGFFIMPLNLGISCDILRVHSVNFGAIIPLFSQTYRSNYIPETSLNTYIVQFGYAYNF